MRWGLIPHWAKEITAGNQFINARAETLAEKPAFRECLEQRRCLVPASGFYEWKRSGKRSTPHYIRPVGGGVMCFAGLWQRRRHHRANDWLLSCTIVTTEANTTVAPLHGRMPVIVARNDYQSWLSPGPLPQATLDDILGPWPGELEAYEVSELVNSVRHDEPGCITRGPAQLRLL